MDPLVIRLENPANLIFALTSRQLQCVVNGSMELAKHLKLISDYPEISKVGLVK